MVLMHPWGLGPAPLLWLCAARALLQTSPWLPWGFTRIGSQDKGKNKSTPLKAHKLNLFKIHFCEHINIYIFHFITIWIAFFFFHFKIRPAVNMVILAYFCCCWQCSISSRTVPRLFLGQVPCSQLSSSDPHRQCPQQRRCLWDTFRSWWRAPTRSRAWFLGRGG